MANKEPKKLLYIAYGSNINLWQMALRCPHSKPLDTTMLKGWELEFRGVANITEKKDAQTPVLLWELDPRDIPRLDRYEGFPGFYYKKEFRVQYKGILTGRRRTITAFAYIMHEDRPLGIPSMFYMKTCREGYDTFGFDRWVLNEAYEKSLEACGDEGL